MRVRKYRVAPRSTSFTSGTVVAGSAGCRDDVRADRPRAPPALRPTGGARITAAVPDPDVVARPGGRSLPLDAREQLSPASGRQHMRNLGNPQGFRLARSRPPDKRG